MNILNRNIPFASALILFGLISIFIEFELISLNKENILAYTLIYFGIYSFYIEFSISRLRSIIGASSFFIGIILFLSSHFIILHYSKILFPTILFVLSVNFLYLFIESSKNKSFLILGLTLFALAIFAMLGNKYYPLIDLINRISDLLFRYWYLVLILIGLELVLNRKN